MTFSWVVEFCLVIYRTKIVDIMNLIQNIQKWRAGGLQQRLPEDK